MCDDEHFADTHDLSMGKNRFVPKCSDLSRYYYVADGSYMSGFDADAMAGIIMKHYDEEQAEVKFETEAAYKEALKGLGKAETSLAFVNAGIDLSRISYCGTEGFIVKTIIEQLHDRLKDEGISEDLIKHVEDRLGHDRRYGIDPTKIKNDLGWYPETTFEVGIVKTIDWYLANEEWMDRVTSGQYQSYYAEMYKNR